MLCRLCFAVISKRRKREQFTPGNSAQFVHELIQKYFQLTLSQDDVIVQICPDCWTHLNDFQKFCEYVQHKQYTWHQIGKAQDEIEIEAEAPLELKHEIVDSEAPILLDSLADDTMTDLQELPKEYTETDNSGTCPPPFNIKNTETVGHLQELKELPTGSTESIKTQFSTNLTATLNKSKNLSEPTQVEPVESLQNADKLPTCSTAPVINLISLKCTTEISKLSPLAFDSVKIEPVESLQDPNEPKLSPSKLLSTTENSEAFSPLKDIKLEQEETPDEEFSSTLVDQRKYNLKELEKIEELLKPPIREPTANKSPPTLKANEQEFGFNSKPLAPAEETYEEDADEEDGNLLSELGTQDEPDDDRDSDEDDCDSNSDDNEDDEKNAKSKTTLKYNETDKLIASYIQLKCDICKISLETFTELRQHFNSLHNVAGYVECCGRRFARRYILVDHIHLHMNPNFFQCKLCNKTLKSSICLGAHMKSNHSNIEDFKHKCSVCDMRFPHRQGLTYHSVKHQTERKFSCSLCEKRFVYKYRLESHIRGTHDSEPRVQCSICGNWLKNKLSLRSHIQRLHNDPLELPCEHCDRIFSTKSGLNEHIKLKHDPTRIFECSFCDKSFNRKINLKDHLCTHTGEKNYTCPHCSREFRSFTNMHSHMKRNHHEKWLEAKNAKNALRKTGQLPATT